MRRIVLVSCLAVACQATKELPEGRIDTRVHAEYAEFRPVTIAVLPVDAPNAHLRTGVRREIYKALPDRKYAPFRLDEVDARINTRGEFEGGSLDWDATLKVDITKWKPILGTSYFAGSGVAEMRHKTGEVLWTCAFHDYPFPVPSRAAQLDDSEVPREIAYVLVDKRNGRLPECPPPPRE